MQNVIGEDANIPISDREAHDLSDRKIIEHCDGCNRFHTTEQFEEESDNQGVDSMEHLRDILNAHLNH